MLCNSIYNTTIDYVTYLLASQKTWLTKLNCRNLTEDYLKREKKTGLGD